MLLHRDAALLVMQEAISITHSFIHMMMMPTDEAAGIIPMPLPLYIFLKNT